jgi:hypothetical protein
MSSENAEKVSSGGDDLNLDASMDERSLICNPVFHRGYSVGWHFVLPEAFKEALDIRLTPRVSGGKNFDILTQGRGFNFKVGDVLYDTRKAYELAWENALRHIGHSVQVEAAEPTTIETKKEYKTTCPVKYLENGKERVLEGMLSLKRTRTLFGRVKFTLFKPVDGQSKIEPVKTFETDQERFVLFLQTGVLRSKNNEVFSLARRPSTDE